MRPIKKRTYYNFMRVVRMIEAKGYDHETAADITRRIFNNYEFSPDRPVLDMVAMVITAEEYSRQYPSA